MDPPPLFKLHRNHRLHMRSLKLVFYTLETLLPIDIRLQFSDPWINPKLFQSLLRDNSIQTKRLVRVLGIEGRDGMP